jgi:hypothetical protein
MKEERFIWESGSFKKDPFKVPEGYFDNLSDRIMASIGEAPSSETNRRKSLIKPWMIWISSAAAVLVLGWFGISELYLKPHQEKAFQQELTLLVDYFAEELHEGQLAGYVEDYDVEVTFKTGVDFQDLIESEPEAAEEIIYQSLGN